MLGELFFSTCPVFASVGFADGFDLNGRFDDMISVADQNLMISPSKFYP
jgi:hypothetical protein